MTTEYACPEFRQLKRHYDDTLLLVARHTDPDAAQRERAVAILRVAADMLSQHQETCLVCRPRVH